MMLNREFRVGVAATGGYASGVPVETWAAKVMSSNSEMTGKEVATKVMKEVGPHLNMRVHEVKVLKGRGRNY